MNLKDFTDLIHSFEQPVVLLEGKRNIPLEYHDKAVCLGSFLAQKFPHLRFRSGNASGSDEAFSKGVAAVDASRLQIFSPYQGHRKSKVIEYASYSYPSDLNTVSDERIAYESIQATPANKGLIELRHKKGAPGAKGLYLMRDTMKVLGNDLFKEEVAAGIFYTDPDNSESGGTGHTIRVCRNFNIPVIFQNSWKRWV